MFQTFKNVIKLTKISNKHFIFSVPEDAPNLVKKPIGKTLNFEKNSCDDEVSRDYKFFMFLFFFCGNARSNR